MNENTPPTDQGGKVVHRRAHRKSRHGCTFCKKRRIKCDEQKPACTNCVRRSLVCSLGTNQSTASSPASTACVAASVRCCATSLDVGDFELFHHFCHVTSKSFSNEQATQYFWSVTVPRLSFRHQFLLHAVITLGALHLRHMKYQLERDMPAGLLDKANVHWEEALRLASPLLSRVTESNCAALYLFATITCLHTFALGPCPGELLIFNQNGPSHWLTLFRGLRSIEQACDFASVQNEELHPIFPLSGLELNKVPVKALDPSVQEALEALASFIDINVTKDDERSESLVEALTLLRRCYTVVHDEPAQVSAYTVFSWLHRVSDHYLKLVQATDPVALLLFSYFVVLIKRLECAWMVKDWPTHLMSEIYACMPLAKRFWLSWPMEQVGWLPAE
ncbi:C6 zinc finger protein [Dactylonectria estremocensis]|uniref:C6 zinc finger protein n=1 Tax=Dactylonectria estremocensis TaxID=1079267 RepID=A0A9P9IH50_9HYPO|nr:C6 zinc finger protein [Dactylonectria estremocensis]